MKTLVRSPKELSKAGRWDIDFHLPAEGIQKFSTDLLKTVDKVAFVATEKRDPTSQPDELFKYIDIASIDVSTGVITNPQELTGEEAPSRARKVVRAYDIVISTCRPTRGAIAVVPLELHNQIASTAFTVLRAKPGTNPLYLHYAIRLASTLEQFRKWSTGSSYPAILDADVLKTLVPVPSLDEQEAIAALAMNAFERRDEAIRAANAEWASALDDVTKKIGSGLISGMERLGTASLTSLTQIEAALSALPELTFDKTGRNKIDLSGFLAGLFEEEAA